MMKAPVTREAVESVLGYQCRYICTYHDTGHVDVPIYFTNGVNGEWPLTVLFMSGAVVPLANIEHIEVAIPGCDIEATPNRTGGV